MKRRDFLQTSAFGLMGFGLPAGVFSLIGKQHSGVQQWLSQLTAATGARKRSALLGQPESLLKQVRQTNDFLARRGFVSLNSSLFFYPNGDYCFYPLVLRHASAGLTDFLVPVLGRQSDGSWRQVLVLTGYQLEALARAAGHLATSETPLHELLLPTGPIGDTAGVFPTTRGTVQVDTRLSGGSAHTQVTVTAGRTPVFSEKFASEHSLSSSASIAA